LHPLSKPPAGRGDIDFVENEEADAREDESSQYDAHFVDTLGVGTIPPEAAASDLPAGERLAVGEHGAIPDAGGDPTEHDKGVGPRHEPRGRAYPPSLRRSSS